MGRKASISVKLCRRWHSDPIWLEQWRALSPRYARLYERLKAVASLGKQQRGVIELVGRSGERMGVRKSQVALMLEGAKTLGFVEESVPNCFEVQSLPPISSLSRAKIEHLKSRGVPLFHRNSKGMDETWPLYVHWCKTYEARRKRPFIPERPDEVKKLKDLVRTTGDPLLKLAGMMELHIERHPALELDQYGIPTTLEEFWRCYRGMVWRLDEAGIVFRRRRST